MLKAGRQMQACLKLVDLVVELLDARLPLSSRNPAFRRLLVGKPVCLVANKADLADPDSSQAWSAWFRHEGETAVFVSTRRRQDMEALVPALRDLVEADRRRRGAVRPLTRPVRIMIAGVPNVGKSTLVNRLAERRRAAVGPKPGVTRQNQWIRLRGNLELLDTPGVLWPQVRDKTHELQLALIGAMKDEIPGVDMIARCLWTCLRQRPGAVDWTPYGLLSPPENADDLLAAVGRRRGYLRPGGVVDILQSATALVKDFREGRLGRFTLEWPPAADDAGGHNGGGV